MRTPSVALLIASLCGACSLAACATSANGAPLALTQADDQREVRIAAGRDFTVRLPSNPSTGYSWKLDPIDAARLELVEEAKTPAANPMPGAPGEVVFHFRAKAAGAAPISLRLVRPWEATAAPAQVYKLNLIVE